jgi:hypothetical protein
MVVSAEFYGCLSNEIQHLSLSLEVVDIPWNQKRSQVMKEIQFDKVMCIF